MTSNGTQPATNPMIRSSTRTGAVKSRKAGLALSTDTQATFADVSEMVRQSSFCTGYGDTIAYSARISPSAENNASLE